MFSLFRVRPLARSLVLYILGLYDWLMAVLSAWYRLAPQEISHANLATISLSLVLSPSSWPLHAPARSIGPENTHTKRAADCTSSC